MIFKIAGKTIKTDANMQKKTSTKAQLLLLVAFEIIVMVADGVDAE